MEKEVIRSTTCTDGENSSSVTMYSDGSISSVVKRSSGRVTKNTFNADKIVFVNLKNDCEKREDL